MAVVYGFGYPEVGDGGEEEYENEETASLVVEEKTDGEKECIAK